MLTTAHNKEAFDYMSKCRPTSSMVLVYEANKDKSYKMNSSLQVLSSVSFSDLKLNLGLVQLGKLLAVVAISQIFYFGANLLAFNLYTCVFFDFNYYYYTIQLL